MENIDVKIIKSRYVFPGNLKIPIEVIESMTESQKNRIYLFMSTIRDHLIDAYDANHDLCVSIDIPPTQKLYADYKNGKLNFYIEDFTKNVFTQICDLHFISRLERKESILYKQIKESTIKVETVNRTNTLTSTLIHGAYDSITHNRVDQTY